MTIEDIRRLLVSRLIALQATDGRFETWISSDRSLRGEIVKCRTNFFDGLVLSSVCAVDRADTGGIRHALMHALRSEVGSQGSVNYWSRQEPLRATRPYPDDLDTTACVLSALVAAHPESAARFLGGAVRALTSVETQEGGPYRTWLVSSGAPVAWRDVDLAVNANIAFYLSEHDIRLEPLDVWLAERITQRAYASPYYPSPFSLWYFLARGYVGTARAALLEDILRGRKPDGSWDGILEDALATCALMRLDPGGAGTWRSRVRLARRVAFFAERIDRMPVGAFCIDAVHKGVPSYAGSPALTIAVCLEALIPVALPSAVFRSGTDAEEMRFVASVRALLAERTHPWGEPLASRFSDCVHRLLAGMPGVEIPLLPFRFNVRLAQSRITHAHVCALAQANVLGWIAYTIYDHVWDGEGDARDLPLANSCLRQVDVIFFELARAQPGIADVYADVMNALERANARELTEMRLRVVNGVVAFPSELPSYGDLSCLADRSFGYALGPLCILLLNGFTRASSETAALVRFFRHAFIARQLDDDAHDWAEDLAAGRLNAVAEELIREHRAQGHRCDAVDANGMDVLQQFFWSHQAERVAARIDAHIALAERALVPLPWPAAVKMLCGFLSRPRESAARVRRGVRGTQAFMKAYRDASSSHT